MARKIKIDPILLDRADISLNAKLVFAALDYYAYRKDECWPSRATIGKLWGISEASVKRAIHELKTAKLVHVLQRPATNGDFHSNKYTLWWSLGRSYGPSAEARYHDPNKPQRGSIRPATRVN